MSADLYMNIFFIQLLESNRDDGSNEELYQQPNNKEITNSI